jgi:glucokinase
MSTSHSPSAETESFGVDVGGTSVKVALLAGGKPRWTGQSRFYSKPSADQLRQAIREAVDGREVRAARTGLCVPGLLDEGKEKVLLSVNVPGLMNLPLRDLVRSAVPGAGEVSVINDAVASATDFARRRGLIGRVLAMALGTGVGMGVLDDGKPLLIEGESPGHIGQVDVDLGDGTVGPDGGAGGLEGYIGVPALKARYGDDLSAALPKFTAADPPLRALARAIRIAHAIYRPHHVGLIGGIGVRLAPVLATLRALCDNQLTSVARPGWTLACGDDDYHAARGAASLAATI